jgi:hypothetical protein
MLLTTQEAAVMLGYSSVDDAPIEKINILLPAVDEFIRTGTGKDWAVDNPIDPTAKLLASALFTSWFDDPGMIGKANGVGPLTLIGQLHAKALEAAI